ncbi:hypothetical protein J056_001307 [Wallemia ichthyophaga EXF-994]|uniref:Uncharacterized protein n=1 Tax=Wallemia ichthyophaga (strain EXF-994 / CBS 113033) TaxID=1299270 RepID=R9AD52_WALI9|nr:uncharacterized protein J056_001307 [Wallemia ichthyophaga EXF-994]EOR00078.1 hypothetical protein J056_001307 [Wallemia ichthyophaga EXF-994]
MNSTASHCHSEQLPQLPQLPRRGLLPKSTKLNPFLNAYKQHTQPPRRKGFDIVSNNQPQQFSLNLTQQELARKC